MENSFYHELRRWRNILQQSATKYFHCIMIPEAERPFRQTHPAVFNSPSHPQSSGPQRSIIPPLERDAFSSTHEFIQLLSKAKNPSPSHSTKPRKGATEGKKRKSKRHQPHISGQCSFHSAYILALLWG